MFVERHVIDLHARDSALEFPLAPTAWAQARREIGAQVHLSNALGVRRLSVDPQMGDAGHVVVR